jgi:O-antigen ligase
MPDLLFDRIGLVVTGEETTGAGRTEIWRVGLHALERFGWFGAGLSNFPVAYDRYAYTAPGDPSRGAHSIFLGTWVELGVVGLVFLLAVLFSHLRSGRGMKGSVSEMAFPAAIEAACFGFLVIAVFSDALWSKAIWMPWILTVWASRVRVDRPIG